MGKKLAIYVTSDEHMGKLLKLCKAAKNKDVEVSFFLTHIGTRLTQDSRLEELLGLAHVALCKVGFESLELKPPETGLAERAYASQSHHAEMILDCDQYISF